VAHGEAALLFQAPTDSFHSRPMPVRGDRPMISPGDLTTSPETACLEVDAVSSVIILSAARFVTGDALGRFHRLEAGTGRRGSEMGSRAERLIHNERFESGLPRKPDLPAK